MVAIVGGNGLGLFNASGESGQSRVGMGNDRAYVNASTGNLILQSQDDYLAALGLDLAAVRTYNSQGLLSDDNGDNWQMSFYRRLYNLPASGVYTDIVRENGDGNRATFVYDSGKGYWLSSEGSGAHDTLKASGSTWIYEDTSTGLTEVYDSAGKITSFKNRDGWTTTFTYTGNLITTITDSSGDITTLTYDSSNNLTDLRLTLSTANGGTTTTRVRYGYDSANRLIQVKVDLGNIADALADDADSDGATAVYVTSYEYDGSSRRIARITQSDGSELKIGYETSGSYRVTSLQQLYGYVSSTPQYRSTSFAYNDTIHTTEVTDPMGGVTTYTCDTANRLTKIESPALSAGFRNTIEYTYDAKNNVTRMTTLVATGVTQIVDYEYDASGNLTLSRDNLGNTVTRTYNSADQIESETVYLTPDPDGSGSGQPSNGLITRYIYDSEQHLAYVVTSEGRVTQNVYNGAGTRDGLLNYVIAYTGQTYSGAFTKTDLDTWISGTVTKAQSERTEYTYDNLGQLASVKRFTTLNADGTGNGGTDTTIFVYSRSGELLQKTPLHPNTTSTTTVTYTYTYDGLGRLLTATDPTGRVSASSYDGANNRIVLTAGGLTTTSVYNQAGDLITLTQEGSGLPTGGSIITTRNFYDANGRLRMTTDPNGNSTHYIYDAAGKLVAQVDAQGALTETRYDGAGRVVSMLSYDVAVADAQVISSGQPVATTLAALITSLGTVNPRATHYVYDGVGRLVFTLVEDTDGTARVGSVSQRYYDGAGRLVKETAYAQRIASSVVLTAGAMTTAVSGFQNHADNRTTRHFYSNDGLLQATLDAEGYLSENVFDAAGRLTKAIRYATATNTAQRASGTLTDLRPATDAKDQVEYFFYDARGQKIGNIDAENYFTSYVYTNAGLLLEARRYAHTVAYGASLTMADYATQGKADVGAQTIRASIKTYGYDTLGRILTVTDASLNGATAAGATVVTLTRTRDDYDAVTGFLIRVTTGDEAALTSTDRRITEYRYDALGRLLQEVGGEGGEVIRLARASGNPQATIDAAVDAAFLAYGTRYEYDAAGRRIKATEATGKVTLYYYDKPGRLRYLVTSASNVAEGEVTETTYNPLGDIVGVKQYANRVSMSGLTAGGTPPSPTADAVADRVIGNEYFKTGLLKKFTDAETHAVQYAYSAFGQLTGQITDIWTDVLHSDTRTDAFTYDRRGFQKASKIDSISGGLQLTETREYDAFGRLIKKIDPVGNEWKTAYDRLGRIVTTEDALHQAAATTYDAFAQVLTQIDKNGATTSYLYGIGKVTMTTAEGVVTKASYDRYGSQIRIEFIDGGIAKEVRTWSYDRNGRLKTSVVDNISGGMFLTATSEYAKSGLLLSTIDARGNRISYAYDAANRVLTRTVDPSSWTQPDGSTGTKSDALDLVTSYTYNAFGETITVTDANGIATDTVFDRTGRTVAVVFDTAGLKIATTYIYAFDNHEMQVREGRAASGGTGNWTFTGGASITQYSYDRAGRRRQERRDVSGLELYTNYAYDKNGNLTRKAHVGQAADIDNIVSAFGKNQYTWYVYDADNRLKYTIDALGGVNGNEYDADGNVTATTRYANALSTATLATFGAIVSSIDITPDTVNDRTTRSIYDSDGRLRYTLDSDDLLTGYAYDLAGRETERIRYMHRLQTTTLTYAAIKAEVTVTGFYQSNLDQRTVREYDAAGRLTKITDSLGKFETYAYDAAGNKTSFVNKLGNTTYYIYDAVNRLIEERAGTSEKMSIDVGPSAGVTLQWVLKTTRFEYDNLGNLTKRLEGYRLYSTYPFVELRSTRYLYDGLGRQVRVVMPTVGVYNEAADTTHLVGAGARPETSTALYTQAWYDNVGNALVNRNAAGKYAYKFYDPLGRLKYEVDEERYVTTYVYDSAGNLRETSRFLLALGADSALTSYELSLTNDLNAGESSATSVTVRSKAFTAHGRVRQLIDATFLGTESRKITTTYDALDRKTVVTQPAVFSYLADGSGSWSATAGSPTSTYQYNNLGDMTAENILRKDGTTQDWNVTRYQYDKAGRVVYQLDAEGYLTWLQYDEAGRLKSRTEYAKRVTSSGADASGGLAGFVQSATAAPMTAQTWNQVPVEGYDRITTYIYDQLDRMTETWVTSVNYSTGVIGGANEIYGGSVRQQKLEFNALGNIIASTDALDGVTRTYYDTLGQIVGVTEPSRVAQASTSSDLRAMDANIVVTNTPNAPNTTHNIDLRWVSLASWGTGSVRVTVTGSNSFSSVQTFASGATAYNYTWTDANAGFSVTSYLIEKDIGTGGTANWVTAYDSTVAMGKGVFRFDYGGAAGVSATDNALRLAYRSVENVGADGDGETVVGDWRVMSLLKVGNRWMASVPTADNVYTPMPAGQYEFYVYRIYTDPVTHVNTYTNLEDPGGTLAVARSDGSHATVAVEGGKVEMSPLTRTYYDVLGNAVRQIDYANGVSDLDIDPLNSVVTSSDDRYTDQRFDVLGRRTSVIDATGSTAYMSYDEFGNVRRRWIVVSDLGESGAHTQEKTDIYRYDRIGRQVASVAYVRNGLSSTASVEAVYSAYNGYGEQIARHKSANDNDTTAVSAYEEKMEYDAAGRLYQNNQGGVNVAYAYDLQGNLTQQAVLAGSKVTGPDGLKNYTGGAMRTDYVRDRLGRIIEQRDPGYVEDVPYASQNGPGAVRMSRPLLESSDYQITNLSGSAYRLTLLNAATWGLGKDGEQYKIRIKYTTAGIPSLVTADSAISTGAAPTSFDFNAGFFGLGTIDRVQLLRNGVAVRDTDATGFMNGSTAEPSRVAISMPPSPGITLPSTIKVTSSGGTVTNVSLISAGPGESWFLTAGLANGTYTYEFTTQHNGWGNAGSGAASDDVTYAGSFTVASGLLTAVAPPTATTVTRRPTVLQKLDRWGNAIEVTDPRWNNGNSTAREAFTTHYYYDYANRITIADQMAADVMGEDGNTTAAQRQKLYTHYDAVGHVIETIDARGATRRSVYDLGGQLVREFDAYNAVTEHRYNVFGNEVRTVDKNGGIDEKRYDKLGRLIRQERRGYNLSQERHDEFTYDQLGNRLAQYIGVRGDIDRIYDPDGDNDNDDGFGVALTTRYHYDTQGRLVQTLLGGASGSIYSTSVYDDRTAYTYDYQGRKLSERDGNGALQSWSYGYDRLGTYTDIAGVVTTYTYDGAAYQRLSAQDSTTVYQATLAGSGHRDIGGTEYKMSGGQHLAYTYYDNGRIKTVTDTGNDANSGNANPEYDRNYLTAYSYDLSGRCIGESMINRGTGAIEQYTRTAYDNLGRIVSVQDLRSQVEYTYDESGNRRRISARYTTGNGLDAVATQQYWYTYDLENRVWVSEGGFNGSGVLTILATGGQLYSYDAMGNRTTSVQYANPTTLSRRLYTYDADNRLSRAYYDGDDSVTTNTVYLTSQRWYDTQGRVITYDDYGDNGLDYDDTHRTTTYDSNGHTSNQKYYKWAFDGTTQRWVQTADILYGSDAYDGAGTLLHYGTQAKNGNGSNGTLADYYYGYIRIGGGYQEAWQEVTAGSAAGTTYKRYDAGGNLVYLRTDGQHLRDLLSNAEGRILRQDIDALGSRTRYAYAEGNPIGMYGNQSTIKADFKPTQDVLTDDFASGGTTYVVQAGDTLPKIANTLWGDSSLWYLIADANGLGGTETLDEGILLQIPQQIGNHNNSTTHKVYNPGEIVGDTTPTPIAPPKKRKWWQRLLAAIIVVVVAIVVASLTGPQTSAAIVQAMGGTLEMTATGVSITATGAFSVGTIATTATIGGAVAGAAAGAIASQLTAIALDAQDHFSWKNVGVAALSAGLTAGIGGINDKILTWGQDGKYAANVAYQISTNVISQSAGIMLGTQDSYSWSSVAAAAMGGVFDAATNRSSTDNPQDSRLGRNNTAHDLTPLGMLKESGIQLVRGVVVRSTQIAINRTGKIDMVDIAANAFGTALGNSIVEHYDLDGRREKEDASRDAQRQAAMDGGYVPLAFRRKQISLMDDPRAAGLSGTLDLNAPDMAMLAGNDDWLRELPLGNDGVQITEPVGTYFLRGEDGVPQGVAGGGANFNVPSGLFDGSYLLQRVDDAWISLADNIERGPLGLVSSALTIGEFVKDAAPVFENATPTGILRNAFESLITGDVGPLMKSFAPGLGLANLLMHPLDSLERGRDYLSGQFSIADTMDMQGDWVSASLIRSKAATDGAFVMLGGADLGLTVVNRGVSAAKAAIASWTPEGIVYSRIDLNGEVLPYGGQAISYKRYLERQTKHARAYPDADFEFTIVDRAKPGVALDVAEHKYVQRLTGGVAARKSPLVSNKKDPVGPARRPGLGLPEPSE